MDARTRPKAKAAEQLAASPASTKPSLCLEALVGFSSPSSSCVAHHAAKNALFYTAGSTVVLFDCSSRSQLAYFHNKTGKPLACVASSRCGKFFAAGERGGSPGVQVFEVDTGRCITTLGKAHKYGIASLSFSPDGRLLATTGSSSDGQVCLWDWHSGSLLGRQHTRAAGLTACFTEDGTCVVTAGKEHFKVWSLSQPATRVRASGGSAAAAAAAPGGGLVLNPKPASLKEYKTCTFVSMQCAPVSGGGAPAGSGLYALSSSGILLLMRATGRTIDKSVNVQVKQAYGLAVSASLVACACSAGVVRVFATRTLAFKCNLPRPAARLSLEVPAASAGGTLPAEAYPDAVACSFDASGSQLSVMYDRSIIVWDVSDISKVSALRCLTAHAGGIWDAALLPRLAAHASADGGVVQPLELVSGSEDGLIRFWGVQQGTSRGTIPLGPAAQSTDRQVKASTASASPLAPGAGVAARCLATSPDGCHLAVGDQMGNLRVFDTQSLELLVLCAAHDTEVLSLSFSSLGFLATGGRDGLIHIFDCCQNYTLLHTLDEHGGAAVTAVRFSRCDTRLLSCGADRAVVFRSVVDKQSCATITHHREQLPVSSKAPGAGSAQLMPPPSPGAGSARGVLYDMALDASGQLVVTVGQDGAIRLFDVDQHRAVGVLWQEQQKDATGEGSLAVRVALDPSGSLAFCACADGSVAVYDLPSKQLLARSAGRHAGVATAVLLTDDFRSVMSVGSDGCVMQWAVPQQLVQRMAAWMVANPQLQAAPQPVERTGVHVHGSEAAAPQLVPRRQAWGAAVPAAVRGPPAAGSGPLTPAAAAQAPDEVGPAGAGEGANTLMRLQQGKPLLSADKLPRWARRLPLPTFDLPADHQQQDSPMPDANTQQGAALPQSGADGDGLVWVSRPSDKLGQAGKATPGSAQAAVGEVEEEVVVCQPPDLGPDARFDVQGAAEAEGEEDEESGDEVEPEEAGVQEGHGSMLPQVSVHLGAAGEEACAGSVMASGGASNRLPGSGFTPEAGAVDEELAGPGGLRRDLFREHFDNLDQVSITSVACAQDEEGQQDSRRLSLTAAYRKKALAMLRAEECKAEGNKGAAPAPAASPLAASGLSPPVASVAASVYVIASRGSGLHDGEDPRGFKGHGTPAWPPSSGAPPAGATPAAQAAGAGPEVQSGLRASQALARPMSPYRQLSPHRRAGQMTGELVRMRERLESLQQQFEEQNKRASPWKQQQRQAAAGARAQPAISAAAPEASLSALPQQPQQVAATPHAASTQQHQVRVAIPGSPKPAGSAMLQDNPMFNSTPTVLSNGSPSGFAFGDGPAVLAFSNAMYGGASPTVTRPVVQSGTSVDGAKAEGGDTASEITLAGLGGDAAPAVGQVSPSICTIRKKAKVTIPGFRSRMSPSSNKFSSMAELSCAMAAESSGARAVPSAIAAEPGRGAASSSVPSAMRTPPPRKLRTAEEYQAALLRLHSAATEVAELWGELQGGEAPDRSTGAASTAGNTPGIAQLSFAPSGPESEVSNLQAQLQQGVGKSLQTLVAVLGTSALTPLSINGPPRGACD